MACRLSRTPPAPSAPNTAANVPATSARSAVQLLPSKNLGAYGDGGMTVTNDPDWAARMACLRCTAWSLVTTTSFSAGMPPRRDPGRLLRVKLPHLDRWSESRQAAARRYDVLIEENGLDPYLPATLVRPQRRTYSISMWYALPMATRRPDAPSPRRQDRLRDLLPDSASPQECLSYLGHAEGDSRQRTGPRGLCWR